MLSLEYDINERNKGESEVATAVVNSHFHPIILFSTSKAHCLTTYCSYTATATPCAHYPHIVVKRIGGHCPVLHLIRYKLACFSTPLFIKSSQHHQIISLWILRDKQDRGHPAVGAFTTIVLPECRLQRAVKLDPVSAYVNDTCLEANMVRCVFFPIRIGAERSLKLRPFEVYGDLLFSKKRPEVCTEVLRIRSYRWRRISANTVDWGILDIFLKFLSHL